MEKEHSRSIFGRRAFLFSAAAAGAFLAAFAAVQLAGAFTGPSANPPTGSGSLSVSGSNIGIGTSTPGYKLDVQGGQINSSGGYCINGGNCISSWPTGSFTGSGSSGYVAKFTGTSALGNSMLYDAGSAIGVGTAVPANTLEVNGSADVLGRLAVGTTTTSTATLNVNGTISGTFTGTVAGGNVSAGTFGSNTGGGNYTFPAKVNVAAGGAYQYASQNIFYVPTSTVGGSNYFFGGAGTLAPTGPSNLGIGLYTLSSLTSGHNNIAIGDSNNPGALPSCTTCQSNIAIGEFAMASTTTGFNDVAIGPYAMGGPTRSVANPTWNVAIGAFALENTYAAADYNTAIGAEAGWNQNSSTANTFVGYQSGDSNFGTGVVSFDTTLGSQAGGSLSGSYDTLLGFGAGNGLYTGSNDIVIGEGANLPSATQSNALDIGDVLYGTNLPSSPLGPAAGSAIEIPGILAVGTTTTSTATLNVQASSNSTVRIGTGTANPGCIEMYDSVNSATLEYLYFASGSLVGTTSKPSFCQ